MACENFGRMKKAYFAVRSLADKLSVGFFRDRILNTHYHLLHTFSANPQKVFHFDYGAIVKDGAPGEPAEYLMLVRGDQFNVCTGRAVDDRHKVHLKTAVITAKGPWGQIILYVNQRVSTTQPALPAAASAMRGIFLRFIGMWNCTLCSLCALPL